jgi:hypothetical protein
MIQNRNLAPDARQRRSVFSSAIDMSSDTVQRSLVLLDLTRDIKIIRADMIFTTAGDTGTVQPVIVGTVADSDKYFDFSHTATVAATANGKTERMTQLSTDLLPKGTPLFVEREASGAATNTSVLQVMITYELVDRLTY